MPSGAPRVLLGNLEPVVRLGMATAGTSEMRVTLARANDGVEE